MNDVLTQESEALLDLNDGAPIPILGRAQLIILLRRIEAAAARRAIEGSGVDVCAECGEPADHAHRTYREAGAVSETDMAYAIHEAFHWGPPLLSCMTKHRQKARRILARLAALPRCATHGGTDSGLTGEVVHQRGR